MANGVSKRVLEDLFNSKLKASTEPPKKIRKYAGAYIRDRLREVSFARGEILPPLQGKYRRPNPDAVLKEVRKICKKFEHDFYRLDVPLGGEDYESIPFNPEDVIHLTELLLSLDYSLKTGGRLPRSWKR